jgi:hypothetical protein
MHLRRPSSRIHGQNDLFHCPAVGEAMAAMSARRASEPWFSRLICPKNSSAGHWQRRLTRTGRINWHAADCTANGTRKNV